MGTFATGQVILLPFPFSDLSRSKYRPAVILAYAGRGDWVLSQITSNPYADLLAVELRQEGFAFGGLQRISYARPGKLFTAHESLFAVVAGQLHHTVFVDLVMCVIQLLRPADLGNK
ncbi:MAG: MazF family transcriptional regulator [Magnetococcales bacterium]|nr:MazF family transcriptional regulator [Magnetococcales bacterium]NGZ05076.1 MazF family transcriptional regulator [Magnetococcales bacterium]